MTSAEAVLSVMGPRARDLLAQVSPNDFSNAAHPFGTVREIELGMSLARAHRVSYVGELGWELYIPTDMAAHAFEVLSDAGAGVGLRHVGLHAMDSLRIEKGFRHFGHDITSEDHVIEAGLGFAVKTDKPAFVGRDAVLRKREAGPERRLLQFRLKDREPMLLHAEPILRDGEIVGQITSGAYGHSFGTSLGMGYVHCRSESVEDLLGSRYEIDIAGVRVAADASLQPFYDPTSSRMRT